MKSEKSRGDRMLEVGHLHRVTVFVTTQQLKNKKIFENIFRGKIFDCVLITICEIPEILKYFV